MTGRAVFGAGPLPDLILTFRSLAALLDARFPLVDALKECIDQTATHEVQSALETVCARINAGQSLAVSMAAEPVFPQLAVALVRTGESAGTLADALSHAADILELKQEGHRNLSAALTYPAVIMTVTLLASLFLATVIAPQVGDMYQRLGHDMPLLTRLVIIGGYCLTGLFIILSTIIIVRGPIRRLPKITGPNPPESPTPSFSSTILRKIPFFRTIDETHGTALWTFCLETLLRHRIDLPEALAVTAHGAAGPAIRTDLLTARQRIIAGESPGNAFSTMDTAPPLARRILQAGDRAGDLAEACGRVHTILNAEYQNRTRRILALVEPVAVVIAGCFVILVALAVILPIAELGGLL